MPPAQYSTHCDACTQAGGVSLASWISAPSADVAPCVGGCPPRTVVPELAMLTPIISAQPNVMAIILRMFTFYGVVRSNNEPLTSSRHRLNSLVTAFLDMIAWACPSGRDASAAAAKIEELGPRCDGLWIAKCGRMVNVFIDAGHGGSCDAGSSSAFGGRSA